MPTLIDLDGYAHQTAQTAQGGSGFIGIYDTAPTNVSFDTTNKRLTTHVASAKVAQDGISASSMKRNIAASNRALNGSFYFRVTAAPGTKSRFLVFTGPTNSPLIEMGTDGTVQYKINTGVEQSFAGSKADGLWHRIDFKIDTSGATFTIDVQLDGVAGTQGTLGSQTAADMTGVLLGSNTAGNNLTIWFQDWVLSATAGDYPIGDHHVLPMYPTGEGTDNLLSHISDAGAGTSNLYQSVDDWNGGLPNTSDYVAQTTIDTAAFAEFTLTAPSESAIWDVMGLIAGFASTTGADTGDTQVLTAHGGTLIDHIGNLIDYSGSTTVLGYYRRVLTRISGGWTPSNLGSCVIQWGRSTDVIGNPRLSAVMLEYAAPETNATPTPSVVAAVAAVPAPTPAAGALVTPSVVAAVATVPDPTVSAGGATSATAMPDTVAAVSAVNAPTVTGTALVTPSAVAAVAAVPAPSPSGTTLINPSAVAAVAAVPSPSVTGDGKVSPSVVAAVAAVPAPTVGAGALVTPSVVAAVAAVPAPTVVVGDTTASPAVVAAIAAVPSPSVSGSALVTPGVVAGVAAVPAPTVITTSSTTVIPATVAAITAVPSPSVHGDANLTPSVVAAIASVPDPSVVIGILAMPSTVAAIAAVNAPTVTGGAKATPSTVAAIASVPTPVPSAAALVTPGVVAAVVAVLSPVVSGGATPAPATVAAYADVPTPTVVSIITRTRAYITTSDSAKFTVDSDNHLSGGVTIVEAVQETG